MKVSAFTYVRNGITLGYPFAEAVLSVLPLVDECICVIGDSTDGTREKIANLNNPKIKIVDTVWEEKMRSGGLIFAQQANIGIDNCDKQADWLFHIQADELVHEKDLKAIKKAMEDNLARKEVDGLLFKFLNFYGDYKHYAPSRRFHQHEIRIFKNHLNARSYRDSQGFRKYNDINNYLQEKGTKLNVKIIDATIYHYSWVKPPKIQKAKHLEFGKRYFDGDAYDPAVYDAKYGDGYYYEEYDYLKIFKGTHPDLMAKHIANINWSFTYRPEKNNMTLKEKILKILENITGKQFFIYKNYKLIK